MSILVSTVNQALSNIPRFNAELSSSTSLRARLAYARAWYAHRDDKGTWLFGPSKFCGYHGMTAEEYVNDEPRDGRRTERQLSQWFTEVPESTALYEELASALTDFLAGYGKIPSTKMRINVSNDVYEAEITKGDATFEHLVADMMITLAKRLPHEERARVRASI